MAAGLLDRNDAVAYFKQFPQLLDQKVERSELMRPLTLERMFELIAAAKEKDFVIVSHGTPDALLINLSKESKHTIGLDVLDILEAVQATGRELPDAGKDMSRWRRILRRLKIDMPAGWRDLDDERVAALRTGVEQWLDNAATTLDLRRNRLDQIVALVGRVQGRGLGKVDFRGCDLGQKKEILGRFKRFFGASSMRAPKVTSFFGTVDFGTHLNAKSVQERGRKGTVYGKAPKQVAIEITYAGYSAELKGAAESEAAAVEWVAKHVGAFTRYSRRVPLHWLQTNPEAWPKDDDYPANLTTV